MKKNRTWLRALTVTLLLSLCLASVSACRTPSDAAPDTDGATQAGDTTAAIVTTEAATTQPVTTPVTEPATTPATEPTTEPATEPATEPETEAPFVGQTFDATTCIVIPADADEITRNAAAMVAETIAEVAGMTLTVASESGNAPALILEIGSFDTDRSYSFSMDGQTLRLKASDSTTLYFAAEAVLKTWLTPDFGLRTEGVLSLADNRVAELNGLTTRQDTSIRVLSQNVRNADDPNGNSVSERSTRFRKMFIEYRPDLVGTQETSPTWNTYFQSTSRYVNHYTDLGEYGMVGGFLSYENTDNGQSNTILYSKNRFELIDSDSVWLSDTPNEVSSVEGSLNLRTLTWALLKDKLTGETIIFANTHLDHGTDEVRSQQMTILMDYLADRIGQYPFYLTGDFNCYVGSEAYVTAAEHLQDSHKTAWIDLSTVSNTFHSYTEEGKSEIDFVFHNDRTTPVRYEIISKSYGGFVSDHYGVIVEFVN